MKTIGRDKIRKKPLEPRCYSAETIRRGEENEYVYCRGINSKECSNCDAWCPMEDWEYEDFPSCM